MKAYLKQFTAPTQKTLIAGLCAFVALVVMIGEPVVRAMLFAMLAGLVLVVLGAYAMEHKEVLRDVLGVFLSLAGCITFVMLLVCLCMVL